MAGATEQNEEKFKEFINSLLEAQSYDFMNEKALFTRTTLEKTLATFCDIIARELECDSCEILMQIYDPKMVNEKSFEDLVAAHFEKVSKFYSASNENKVFVKNRKDLLKSPLTFPYWAYPKGAASLVAVNSNSPWSPVLKDKTSRLKYVPLKSGITKEIFQEDVARIRDKLSIIETRNFIKLGYADPLVWNNKGWKYVFKNYYGVPIRIHSGGEVIGILKVENKLKSNEDEVVKKLLKESDCGTLAQNIIHKIEETSQKMEDFKSLDVSLLALAYLEADLALPECSNFIQQNGDGLEKIFFIPYPDYLTQQMKRGNDNIGQFIEMKIDSLIPLDDDTRPPMQLFTKSIAEEKGLWDLLGNENSWDHLYAKVKIFYNYFKEAFSNIDYHKEKYNLPAVEKCLKKSMRAYTFEIEDWSNDFHFKVSLKANSISDFLVLYVVVLPTKNELKVKSDSNCLPNPCNYRNVNGFWLKPEPSITIGSYRKHRIKLIENSGYKAFGEFFELEKVGKITDFLMDRLAARMQALTLAFPVAEFTFQDTNKLTWAAFEIGKLIEREISYRANRHDDPMPLTAMEFYRVPIGDLSFVDDMRARRNNLKKSAPNIDVYLKNIIFEMNMKNAVEYSSRIKGYRSYFQRIGERFEGYVRGNIALWVFLLSLIVKKDEDAFQKNEKLKEYGKLFLDNLEAFGDSIKESLDEPKFFDKFHGGKFPDYYGDLKFDSPPFMDEKGWEENDIEHRKTLLLDAFNRIRNNLENEGLRTAEFPEIKNPAGIIDFFQKNQKELDDLLIRDYSFFKRDALSLMIQIANLLNNIGDKVNFNKFREFYQKCRELREFLCSSPQQTDDGKKEYHLRNIFGMEKNKDNVKKKEAWKEIKDFINKYNTGDVFGEKNEDCLKLTARSIYKRIRMLHNILRHQIPSAFLDWELARFDLYGVRMNCLFKNQVFALFEKIWNKGDPFFPYEPSVEKIGDYYQENQEINTNRFRQRWLCLRAHLLEGEYNACQIATLIDPRSVESGYWENISSYNLKSVQYVLGKIFNSFEEASAKKYRNYSWHRHLISYSYCKWYKYNANFFQDEAISSDQNSKDTEWFGSFLFEGVISLLMLIVSSIIDNKNEKYDKNRHGFHKETLMQIAAPGIENLFFKIIQRFKWVVENGITYSNDIKECFSGDQLFSEIQFHCKCDGKITNQSSNDNKKRLVCQLQNQRANGSCCLYKISLDILTTLIDKIKVGGDKKSLGKDIEVLNKIKTDLEKERKFFSELEADVSIDGFQLPLFFFDEEQSGSFSHKTKDDLKSIARKRRKTVKRKIIEDVKSIIEKIKKRLSIKVDKEGEVEDWAFIYRTLKRIRREQKSYLFDMGDKSQKKYAGLWMRSKTEVLGRIKNYALLFSQKELEEKNKKYFCGWNAHDLYYYIHSLIPMEIQVRTELTNTFAVQYHDSIYKLHPPAGTEFPNSMIKTAGENLDKIDREMEIDYEDYVLRYRHRLEEDDL